VEGAAELRAAARRFFALPETVKRGYAVGVGGRGWLPPGVEANAAVEGAEGPPDLTESFAIGPQTPTGDPAVDAAWFPPAVWPAEVPEPAAAAQRWADGAAALSLRLLELCATALGQPRDALTRLARHPTWTGRHRVLSPPAGAPHE
jgi:isopenicillin N synthase-like dioxygenase